MRMDAVSRFSATRFTSDLSGTSRCKDHLACFVNIVESKYLPNPFHNFSHAIDVEYTIRRQMKLVRASSFLSDTQHFGILIAAIGRDS